MLKNSNNGSGSYLVSRDVAHRVGLVMNIGKCGMFLSHGCAQRPRCCLILCHNSRRIPFPFMSKVEEGLNHLEKAGITPKCQNRLIGTRRYLVNHDEKYCLKNKARTQYLKIAHCFYLLLTTTFNIN